MIPEFKAPTLQKTRTAVAGESAAPPPAAGACAPAEATNAESAAPSEPSSAFHEAVEWLWGQGRAETMHPYWAVRRLTPQQLENEVEACRKRNKTAVAGKKEIIPSFNCGYQEYNQSSTTIITVAEAVTTETKFVKVPLLTNTKALAEGEELILCPVVQAKTKQAPKRTWREVSKGDLVHKSKKRWRIKHCNYNEPQSRVGPLSVQTAVAGKCLRPQSRVGPLSAGGGHGTGLNRSPWRTLINY